LSALCNVLLEWDEPHCANKSIRMFMWAWSLANDPHTEAVWNVPSVASMVRLKIALKDNYYHATESSDYEQFAEVVIKYRTTREKQLMERARFMLLHPSGPKLEHALVAFQEIAMKPGHALRDKVGKEYQELRKFALVVKDKLEQAQ